MYLARMTDSGTLSVYEIDDWEIVEMDKDKSRPPVKELREPKTWRYRDGWASVKRHPDLAVMAVHAAMEQREAA